MPFSPVRAPELIELETFVMCATSGSFGAAADRLRVSRPAVSKRITTLEVLAGRALFERGGRGVRLTDAGSTLLTGARRVLEERDVLVGLLAEIRAGGPSPIAGLRDLLGHIPAGARSARLPEARLLETERILEAVLRASRTGVAISDPETSELHEVNEAYCRFMGRSRAELVGKPALETGTWYDADQRLALIKRLRETGALERVVVRIRRPDGSTPAGEISARLIAIAGQPKMLSTIDDISETVLLGLERDATVAASREISLIAQRIISGQPPLQALAARLADIRAGGDFATVLLWDPEAGTPAAVAGDPPWPTLANDLAHTRAIGETPVRLLRRSAPAQQAVGFALSIPRSGHELILTVNGKLPSATRALIARILEDLARVLEGPGS